MVGFYIYPFPGASEQVKQAVWAKGQPIPGFDAALWRRDICGRYMRYSNHGNRNEGSGWEIDHIVPSSRGGETTLDNLQPLNWQNNSRKSDQYPWSC